MEVRQAVGTRWKVWHCDYGVGGPCAVQCDPLRCSHRVGRSWAVAHQPFRYRRSNTLSF